MLALALTKAQAKMPVVPKRGKNPHFRSSYATLDDMLEAVRPVLAECNLAVVMQPVNEGELVGVKTILVHASGQFISSQITMRPSKAGPQEVGSMLTYLKRYSLGAVCGISTDEDDDANAAQEHFKQYTAPAIAGPSTGPQPQKSFQRNPAKDGEPVSENQQKRIWGIAKGRNWSQADVREYLMAWGFNSTAQILRGQYDEFCSVMEMFGPQEAIASVKKARGSQADEFETPF